MKQQQPEAHLDYRFYPWFAHPWMKIACSLRKRQASSQIGNFRVA